MHRNISPDIGLWYKCSEIPDIFEVVAVDHDENCIEIQYFAGEIEELDYESWDTLHTLEIPAPEDWSGPYEMCKEDMGTYFDDVIHPESWDSPVKSIEPEGLIDSF